MVSVWSAYNKDKTHIKGQTMLLNVCVMLRDGDWTAVTSYVTGLACPGFKTGVKPERAPFKLEFASISDQPKLEFSQKEKKCSAAN